MTTSTTTIGVHYLGHLFEAHGADPADRFLYLTSGGAGTRLVRSTKTAAEAIRAVALHRALVPYSAGFWLPAGPAPYRNVPTDEMIDIWRGETAKAA